MLNGENMGPLNPLSFFSEKQTVEFGAAAASVLSTVSTAAAAASHH